MATKPKIGACIGVLCEAFNRKPTAATLNAYHIALADVPDELVDAATQAALVSNREFMPTPGQLRELAVTGGIGYESRAERAWLEFDRAVSQHGADHSVSFADGLINATVRLCGDWVFCCGRTGDDYGVWLKRQFVETYQRLCTGGATESLRAPLMGTLWRENVFFPAGTLAKFPRANTGQVQAIATAQPVLLPPSESPQEQLTTLPADVPRIELKRAN